MFKMNIFRNRKTGKPEKAAATQTDIDFHHNAMNRFGREYIINKARYWKDITLTGANFPKIMEESKPINADFKKVKWAYAHEAFKVISPYYEYVTNLSGLSDQEGLQKILKHVLLEFIVRFWDMPASENHHHSTSWGLLIHSLRVGCENAEKAESLKLFTESGINAEAMMRDKGHMILGAFFCGLFHDTHKLYDYKLFHQTAYRKLEYEPDIGSVLNFKLTHPTNLYEEWSKVEQDTRHHSISLAHRLIPDVFFDSMSSGEVYRFCVDRLFRMIEEVEGDWEDASKGLREDPEQKMFQGLTDATLAMVEGAPDKNFFFRVSDAWCAVISKSFTQAVAVHSVVFPNDASVLHYMNHLGIIAAPVVKGVPQYSQRFNVQYFTDGGIVRMKKVALTFVEAEFVQKLEFGHARKHNRTLDIPDLKIELAELDPESLIAFLTPPLPKAAIVAPPGKEEARKEGQAPTQKTKPQPGQQKPEPPTGYPDEDYADSDPAGYYDDAMPRDEDAPPDISEDSCPDEQGLAEEAFMQPEGHFEPFVRGSVPSEEDVDGQGEDVDPALMEQMAAEISQVTDKLKEPESKEASEREDDVEPEEAVEEVGGAEELPDPEPPVDMKGLFKGAGEDEFSSRHGEILNSIQFINEVTRLLQKGGLNTPTNPLALYIPKDWEAPEKKGTFYLSYLAVGEILGYGASVLESPDGRARLARALNVLASRNVITGLTDGSLSEFRNLSYYSLADLSREKELTAKSFRGFYFQDIPKERLLANVNPLADFFALCK